MQKQHNHFEISNYKKKIRKNFVDSQHKYIHGDHLKGQPEHDGTCKYYYSRDYHMIIKCLSCDAS